MVWMDIQPDMILVIGLFASGLTGYLIQTEGESLFLYYLIPLGLIDWTLNNVFGMVLPLVQGCF